MNYEILEGLKNALARGNNLQQAMMSFYNAGYKKEEIEEAARALNEPLPVQSTPRKNNFLQTEKPNASFVPKEEKMEKIPEIISTTPKDMQLISKYEGTSTPSGKLTTILFIISLLIFILVLIGAVIFHTELLDFFKNLF